MKRIKYICCIYLSVSLIFSFSNITKVKAEDSVTSIDINTDYKYSDYLNDNANISDATDIVNVQIAEFVPSKNSDVVFLEEYEEKQKVVKITNSEGFIEFKIDIKQAGLYSINMDYYPLPGTGKKIELGIIIDNKIPYYEASNLLLTRKWEVNDKMGKDENNNDLKPKQIEKTEWMSSYLVDINGYYLEPLKFNFSIGQHTLRIVSNGEPYIIGGVRLENPVKSLPYSEIKTTYEKNGYNNSINEEVVLEGENAIYHSDKNIYPTMDRSSSITSPNDPSKIRLNTIGGENYESPGDWAIWEFEVEKSGLYEIDMRVKQSRLRGMYSNRRIYINNEVPFIELNSYGFKYSPKWQVVTLGNNDENFEFYFAEGKKYQIKIEVIIGDMGSILNNVENVIVGLNSLYRKMIMITGANADAYRDYELDIKIPDLLTEFTNLSNVLRDQSKIVIESSGNITADINLLNEVAKQLDDMVKKPSTIANSLARFKSNVAALSNWTFTKRKQPLEIDYIKVSSKNMKKPIANETFIQKISFELKSFLASFFEDYNNIGLEQNNALNVWINAGRDQGQILKNLIDNSFMKNSNFKVNLNLVQGSLMEATMTGQGPEVALSVPRDIPVNLAVRGALLSLNDFSEFNVIKNRFYNMSDLPYVFNGKTYGLPETQGFNMMFYRTDIFKDLNIAPPETWDDFKELLFVLSRHNMDVGLPSMDIAGASYPLMLSTFLLQNGLNLYADDLSKTMLDNPKAIDIFAKYTDYYTKYGLPLYYDFVTRFRLGEMPLGIANYGTYNLLLLSAPEIRNLWKMCPIPGTPMADGSINRTQDSSGLASIIFKKCKNPENAWEFLKWWSSDEVQSDYGNALESVMGPSARYQTANKMALKNLPWTNAELNLLEKQFETSTTIAEVPGGYFTSRNLNNAFIDVVSSGYNAREMLEKYNSIINNELKRKRLEFGLSN